ncbi:MAG: helix-turn-helix transcriptional regulator [Paraclostridium sp.]
MCLSTDGICAPNLNTNFIHRLYDYSHLPEDTFGQRLKKLRLMKGLSQYDLANSTGLQRGMISSYEIDDFYPNLDSLKRLGILFNIDILCKEGYSKFLLESNDFKDRLIKWRTNNELTKRDAAKLLNISERSYAGWENGVIMNIKTYNKTRNILIKHSII